LENAVVRQYANATQPKVAILAAADFKRSPLDQHVLAGEHVEK
jgi:hypothetical protein